MQTEVLDDFELSLGKHQFNNSRIIDIYPLLGRTVRLSVTLGFTLRLWEARMARAEEGKDQITSLSGMAKPW